MKRWLAAALLCVSGSVMADLPSSGSMRASDISNEFNSANHGIDQKQLVSATSGARVGYQLSPSIGSLVGWNGKTVEGHSVVRVTTESNQVLTISVSGFSSNPFSDYYTQFDVSCIGVSVLVNGIWSDAGYSYSSGTATWTFTDNFSTPVNNIPSGTSCLVTIKNSWASTANTSLSDYYRGGSLVPNIACNSGVPTSGPISFSDFYGACRVP